MFGRFGIASRLFASFAGVAALSIAAGIIGWVVLRNVDTAQTTIVDQAMPAISEGRIIAETSTQIAAHGALLATAETQGERQAEAEILRSTTDLLSALLDALERDPGLARLGEVGECQHDPRQVTSLVDHRCRPMEDAFDRVAAQR